MDYKELTHITDAYSSGNLKLSEAELSDIVAHLQSRLSLISSRKDPSDLEFSYKYTSEDNFTVLMAISYRDYMCEWKDCFWVEFMWDVNHNKYEWKEHSKTGTYGYSHKYGYAQSRSSDKTPFLVDKANIEQTLIELYTSYGHSFTVKER